MDHHYTLQLHTGNFTNTLYTFDEIKAKLDHILSSIQVKDIILGWNTDKQLNHQLVNYFHQLGIRTLLWLPALSEGEQLRSMHMITKLNGGSGNGVANSEHEQFRFACPNQLINVHQLISIYEEHFADIPFDGVFLDKIRFPSFANGYEEGFGCFCETCCKQMHGIDVTILKTYIDNHDPILLEGTYDDKGLYHFQDAQVDAFYKQRSRMISNYIFKLAAYFNSRKMIVGADVFAPFMAYHVGQNIQEIGKLVDFIKPMFYRYTTAPAGMQYEYDAYVQNFTPTSSFVNYWKNDVASEAAIKQQLAFLANLHATIYAGIEVNSTNPLCTTDQAKITKNLQLFSNLSTIALCWDIMQMDDTILDIL